MRSYILAGLSMLIFFSATVSADTYVRGHNRSDGAYVQPHYRSSPNNSSHDNWSTKGNVNPYTGKEGTKNPNYNYPNNSW